ncbi:MAG: biotin--[Clostridia bacterium]|nr:biotin--[acetyl-CoA-carboxylase] ligase [Clostridia bacterium]
MELDEGRIRAELKNRDDLKITVFDSIDSTNLEAERRIRGGERSRMLIAADSQTDGRGRQGRSFYSPSGGLYLSVAFFSGSGVESVLPVTTAAAVAVARAIEEACGAAAEIKWVNDVYIKGKKVCGILTRAVTLNGGAVGIVTGIGINLSDEGFPRELDGIAGAIGETDRNILAARITERLLSFADDPGDKSYLDEYRERSCVIGREIVYYENGTAHSAVATGIDENGGLEITESNKKKTLTSGEITVRVSK